MIKSFRGTETETIFQRQWSRTLPPDIQRRAMRKLWMIDAATSLLDIQSIPGNSFEKLHGSRKGQYSIRINKQWRICFRWSRGNAYDVEIIDYH